MINECIILYRNDFLYMQICINKIFIYYVYISSQSLFTMEFPKFQHPFTLVIAAPTGCSKSYLVRDIVKYKQEMFEIVPDKIVWFYGIYQLLYDTMPDVTFVEGLPSNY